MALNEIIARVLLVMAGLLVIASFVWLAINIADVIRARRAQKVLDRCYEQIRHKFELAREMERAKEKKEPEIISIGIFDECETIEDCTVEILHNSVTDEYSIGWYRNNPE